MDFKNFCNIVNENICGDGYDADVRANNIIIATQKLTADLHVALSDNNIIYQIGFADGYQQGKGENCNQERIDAINSLVDILTNNWGLDIILAQTSKEELKKFIYLSGEQIKEEEYD